MPASNYLANATLNAIFSKTSDFGTLSSAPTIYVALLTTAPNAASTGSNITEADYTGYSRIATSAGDWNAAANRIISNANAIEFDECTGGSSTITHFAKVDASSGGNVLFYGELDAPLAVSEGITPQFKAGELATEAE